MTTQQTSAPQLQCDTVVAMHPVDEIRTTDALRLDGSPGSGSNPYLDAYLAATDSLRGHHDTTYGNLDTHLDRRSLTKRYAWSVPDEAAIALLVAQGPLVEMAAGTGYWAALVEAAGGDIVAYDIAPPGGHHEHAGPINSYCGDDLFFSVAPGGPEKVADHPDRALFLCWPGYGDGVASSSLSLYTGETVVYVGEWRDGCCGEDGFFDALERDFERVAHHQVPTWPMMHDALWVYRRR